MKLHLPQVTLLGIDCVNIERLQAAIDFSQREIEFGAVKLLSSLPSDDSHLVRIPHIGTIEELSRFCIAELHNYVDTEYVLLVQYDGFVLHPESWKEEFLKYDYVGAPISQKWIKDIDPANLLVVGNGGFSLRSKKFLDASSKLLSEGKIVKIHPEDIALCVWYKDLLQKEGMTFAPVDLATEFSVQEDYGVPYNKPFGFHGFYEKNIDALKTAYPDFPIWNFLPKIRSKRLEKIKQIFEPIAIESHVLGSMARGNTDIYSDIDVWITLENESAEEIIKNRFNYYSQLGTIIHVCEPPQNSPINGVFSSVIYKYRVGLLQVDYSLCPQSTAYTTDEGKHLFGSDLPIGTFDYNPNKVTLPESYRTDFFIFFIFNAIKRLARKETSSLEQLFAEYENLSNRYGLNVKELNTKEHSFDALQIVIENITDISTDNQKKALSEISNFAKNISRHISK